MADLNSLAAVEKRKPTFHYRISAKPKWDIDQPYPEYVRMATSTSLFELHPPDDTNAATAHDSRETNEGVNDILGPAWHV